MKEKLANDLLEKGITIDQLEMMCFVIELINFLDLIDVRLE